MSKNPGILAHKRQTFLNPSLKSSLKDQKEPGFPQTKRPELFPVKAEHSEPAVQYLGQVKKSDKAAFLKVTTKREFQKGELETPGPSTYVTPLDPGKALVASSRPLTSQQSFLVLSGFGKDKRHTVFSGKFKLWDTAFEQDMERVGPGPASLNIRESQAVLGSRTGSTMRSNMGTSKRVLGPPILGSEGIPAPGYYHQAEPPLRPK